MLTAGATPTNHEPAWLGSPLSFTTGTVGQIAQSLPTFERRPFVLGQGNNASGENVRADIIVRIPLTLMDKEIPVGVVSKNYRLVQHHKVLELAVNAFRKADVDVEKIRADLGLTEYGERMVLSLHLPDCPEYRFRPSTDDGMQDVMGLRFDCFNSVEGSTRFVAVLGWLRFVCSNGLIVGTTLFHLRRMHNRFLEIEDLGNELTASLNHAKTERKTFQAWLEHNVHREAIADWIDGPVRKAWGVKAAARAYVIIETGRDAVLSRPFERGNPSERTATLGEWVPGSRPPANNLFDVAQVLSWLAGRRREVPEQLEWKGQIPTLIQQLQRRTAGSHQGRSGEQNASRATAVGTATPPPPVPESQETLPYRVLVDDNFHFMDEDERTERGRFPTYEAALAACKKIVDDWLAADHKPGMTANQLYGDYKDFGDDPFVMGPEDGRERFSAWNYAKMRCAEICGKAAEG